MRTLTLLAIAGVYGLNWYVWINGGNPIIFLVACAVLGFLFGLAWRILKRN